MEELDQAKEKAKKIKLIIFDVDGVLTDGGIYIGEQGELFKSFDVRDGLGISLWQKLGGSTAIITGRESACLLQRAKELHIGKVCQGQSSKLEAYEGLKQEFAVTDGEVAYIGDDLIDIPVMQQAGLALAVGDAVHEVCHQADVISSYDGGRGAVRELIEFILKAQDKWEKVLAVYSQAAVSMKLAQ
jgi:3-deoxy-D-manno-octulosonate 8-phosphate phosphatase (KDO 8-P phosphatase)